MGAHVRVILSAVVMLGISGTSHATADQMYEFGRGACRTVLYGQEPTFGSKYYLRFADLVDMDRDDLCDCVGQQFVENALEQSSIIERAGAQGEAKAMLDITTSNLDRCLPNFEGLDPALQGMIMRGAPEGSHELVQSTMNTDADASTSRLADEELCQKIARGQMKTEFFDLQYLTNWEKQSALKVRDMCTSCVVEMMQDRRSILAQDGEILGQDEGEYHRNYMGSAMTECMHNSYMLPLQ